MPLLSYITNLPTARYPDLRERVKTGIEVGCEGGREGGREGGFGVGREGGFGAGREVCFKVGGGSTVRALARDLGGRIVTRYSTARAMRAISAAMLSGARTKSMHPVSIALSGMSGCAAVSSRWAIVTPPASFMPQSAAAPSPS